MLQESMDTPEVRRLTSVDSRAIPIYETRAIYVQGGVNTFTWIDEIYNMLIYVLRMI